MYFKKALNALKIQHYAINILIIYLIILGMLHFVSLKLTNELNIIPLFIL